MSRADGSPPPRGPGRRRLVVAAVAAVVAGADLAAKAWAQTGLSAVGIEAGPVDLRLAYNPGVAFSLGADAPTWLVVAVTAAITVAVAAFAWRLAKGGGRAQPTALALILGGAVANLVDRAADGVVTDYLHTGWWPTFNLADTAIVIGGLLFAVTSWRGQASAETAVDPPAPRPSDADMSSGPAGPSGPWPGARQTGPPAPDDPVRSAAS